ncbi:hypothetical protein D918_02251 [Trichuris suis]|nr:hypothetical protein D918_02251 [Trichuris suis]
MEYHLGRELLFPEVELKGDILTNISQEAILGFNQRKLPSLAAEKLYVFNGGDIWSPPTKIINASVKEEKNVQEVSDNGDTLDYRKVQFNGKAEHDDRLYNEHSYALPPYLQKIAIKAELRNLEAEICLLMEQ